MHTYLESIGFRNIRSRHEMDNLINQTVLKFDKKNLFIDDDGRMIGEFSKAYAPDMGITVCGEFDEKGNYHPDYSYPYLKADSVSSYEEINLEMHSDKQSFAGAIDDPRLGMTLIFYLINMGEIMCKCGTVSLDDRFDAVRFTGLAREGKIILPAIKNEWWEKESRKNIQEHIKMVSAAKYGDEEAIESLTMEDIDTYSMIQQRILNEDVLSIVDTNFMPVGIECDQYMIIGKIQELQKVKNSMTGEDVWKMELSVCDMVIDVSINAERLMGEPEVGRRFRGQIWLQGEVCL